MCNVTSFSVIHANNDAENRPTCRHAALALARLARSQLNAVIRNNDMGKNLETIPSRHIIHVPIRSFPSNSEMDILQTRTWTFSYFCLR